MVIALRKSFHRSIFRFAVLVAIASCSDNSPMGTPVVPDVPTPAQRRPAIVAVVSGSDQLVEGLAPVPLPLVVRVTDAEHRPVKGVMVSWSGGAGWTPDPAESLTDSLGLTSSQLQIGMVFGRDVVVRAGVDGVAGRAEFRITVKAAPPGSTPQITSLQIRSSSEMTIGEASNVIYTATTALGPAIVPREAIFWTSSNPGIVSVSGSGMVTALSVGPATITARVGTATAQLVINVRAARLKILPSFTNGTPLKIPVGDTIQLRAVYVNVNGDPIGGQPLVTWTSSRPDLMSVSATGLAVALKLSETDMFTSVGLTAASFNASGTVSVEIVHASIGMARVRFAHVADELGPLTFVPSRGDPITVAPGQVVVRDFRSGTLFVKMANFPSGFTFMQDFAGLLAANDHVTLYAVGATRGGALTPVWDKHDAIAPDSSLIRIVMGNTYDESYSSNVYLLPAGAPMRGDPTFCYFHLPGYTEYMRRNTDAFDIVVMAPNDISGTAENPGVEFARLRAQPQAGRATTFVIVGTSRATMGLVTIVDP